MLLQRIERTLDNFRESTANNLVFELLAVELAPSYIKKVASVTTLWRTEANHIDGIEVGLLRYLPICIIHTVRGIYRKVEAPGSADVHHFLFLPITHSF